MGLLVEVLWFFVSPSVFLYLFFCLVFLFLLLFQIFISSVFLFACLSSASPKTGSLNLLYPYFSFSRYGVIVMVYSFVSLRVFSSTGETLQKNIEKKDNRSSIRINRSSIYKGFSPPLPPACLYVRVRVRQGQHFGKCWDLSLREFS